MNPIGSGELRRLADLAGLDVKPSEMAPLAQEISAIIQYVSRMKSDTEKENVHEPSGFEPGEAVALRQDHTDSTQTIRDPSTFAPEFESGFFVVPRPESIGDG